MEILLALLIIAIATALVCGWFCGSAFVAVFLSLPVGLWLAATLFEISSEGHVNSLMQGYLIASLVVLFVIWMPFLAARR